MRVDVAPGLAGIARHLQVAVVGAGPEDAGFRGRFGDGGDAWPIDHAIVAGERFHRPTLPRMVWYRGPAAGEVFAEAGPGVAVVGGFEEVVAAVVDGVVVVG